MADNKYTNEFFEAFEKKYNAENLPKPVKKRKRRCAPIGPIVAFAALGLVVALVAVLCNLPRPKTDEDVYTTLSGVSEAASSEPEKEPLFATFTSANTGAFAYAINSEYGVLIDAATGEVIYQKNADAVIYPASLTKILTLLVAVERITDLDDTFEMTSEIIDPHYKAEASMAGFEPKEVIPVRDLLYGAVLPSGADATTALGIYVAGSEEAFVGLMNQKVAELGLTTAHFCNTSGLHDRQHYCTVKDMAVILKAAMENATCRKVLSTYQYTTSKTPQHPDGIPLTSTMFGRMTGEEPEGATIMGGKTGFTDQAGNCLASFGQNDVGREFIMITVKSGYKWDSIFDHIHTYSTLAPKEISNR